MSEKIVQLNEEVIKGQLKELVRGSVEETLNELLEPFNSKSVAVFGSTVCDFNSSAMSSPVLKSSGIVPCWVNKSDIVCSCA